MNNQNEKLASNANNASRPAWRQLFRTVEGRILLLGIAIAFVGLIVMGLLAFWSPYASSIMGAMSFTNIVFGTIVSMSIGYAAGYSHAFVIFVNIWIETVMLLLFYPVFVFSMRKLVQFPRLASFLESTQAAAERHHDTIRRYGILGLFFFVWLPFWMTGPLVGSAIGYLLGFPAWLTLSVVLAGTFTAMVGWAFLLFSLYTQAAAFGSLAPLLIIGLIILFILAGYRLNRRRQKHR